VTVADAIEILTDLGVLPVILITATVSVAAMLYGRFRR
jgi:hypothetical protein